MADSTTNLDLISASQASKEVTANELFDSMSPACLFGRRANTTSALTWGYYGGKYRKADGTVITVANGTLSLTASATNYIKETDGVVSVTTAAPSGWPGPLASNARALYAVVCGTSSVTSYTDYRTTGIGSGPTAISEPFDVQTFYPGVPTASAKIYRGRLARAVTFGGGFAGSQFTATANATGSTVIDIQKNGASVGSCTIAAGTTTPTFASSGGGAVSFAAGDILSIIAPATPDATLADPAITLAGTR